jgi:2'-5' RNA ligase
MNKFVLWLIPAGSVNKTLSQLISNISKPFNAPVFEPHVTLLGRLKGLQNPLEKKAEKLVSELSEFTVYLTEPDFRDSYYQCLYYKVKATRQLISVYETAFEIFCPAKKIEPFFPHLSLLYGNITQNEKQEISKNFKSNLFKFNVQSIYLVSIDGDSEDWKIVKEFVFKSYRLK